MVSFCKKVVLRNFVKFTGKHLCQKLFIKKESLAQVFSCEFCKIFKNNFFLQNTSAACFCPWIVFFEISFNNCVWVVRYQIKVTNKVTMTTSSSCGVLVYLLFESETVFRYWFHCAKNETVDLVTFAEELLNGKLHFLCSVPLFIHFEICIFWQGCFFC